MFTYLPECLDVQRILQWLTGIVFWRAISTGEHEIFRTLAISIIFINFMTYNDIGILELLYQVDMATCPIVPAYQWYSVAGWYYLTSKLIVIFQIVVSNRAGGQRTGPGGWLLVSWWVWRILPSSLQVSISHHGGQHSYSIEGQRSRGSVVWSVVWCVLVQIFEIT